MDPEGIDAAEPAMEAVAEPDDTDAEVVPADVEDFEESEDFPVLQGILLTYFRREGDDVKFLKRYARDGETSAEFAGLADELREAIRYPKRVTPMVNAALELRVQPMEMRRHLADLLDQITRSGEYDSNDADVTPAENEHTSPEPDELLDYYFRRKVQLPWGLLGERKVPLWSVWISGFAIGGFGLALAQLPWPSWLDWFPITFIALGLVIIGVSSVAMSGLRQELKAPEKEARREQARAAADAKKKGRKEQRSKWLKMLGPDA